MPLPLITLIGNVVAEPELRFTQSGKAVANLRLACNERRKNSQTGEWEDGDSCFLNVTAWNNAEAISQLAKGAKVVVTGTLKQRDYETAEGQKRTAYDVTADNVATIIRDGQGTTTAPASASPDAWAGQADEDVPW